MILHLTILRTQDTFTLQFYLWYTMYGIHHYNGVHSDFSTTVGTSLMACYF